MKHITARASRLPLIALCPGAAAKPEIELDSNSEAARLGSAFHHLLTEKIAGRWADFNATCARWRIEDPKELEKLCAWGWRTWWDTFRPNFPEPSVETPIAGEIREETLERDIVIHLTGTVDVLSWNEDEARVLDPKSGRLDLDHSEQLKAYAWLIAQKVPTVQRVYAATMLVRKWESDGRWYTREELQAWADALAERLSGPERFNPGEHCGYCPRRLECDAYAGWLRQTLDTFSPAAIRLSLEESRQLEPDIRGYALAEALQRARLLERVCKEVKGLVQAELQAAGGSLPTGDGREVYLQNSGKRQIDPAAAWPILADEFGDGTVIEKAITIGVGKIEDLAKDAAGRGQKGAAARAVFDRLEEAGAVTRTTSEHPEIRRVPLQVTSEVKS